MARTALTAHRAGAGRPGLLITVLSFALALAILVCWFAKPALWSESRYQTRGASRMFALHPDGERFAFSPAPPTSNGTRPDKVALFFNFFDELRRIAPATRR